MMVEFVAQMQVSSYDNEMMISPFSLEGEEVFACDGKEIRGGQTRGSASAGVVSEMINIDINININIGINMEIQFERVAHGG